MKTDKPNPPKLLLDEQIWVFLATLLREQGFDVYHVTEVGLGHTPDPEILQEAVKKHQAVVTFNTKDFIPLARQYSEEGKEPRLQEKLKRFSLIESPGHDLTDYWKSGGDIREWVNGQIVQTIGNVIRK